MDCFTSQNWGRNNRTWPFQKGVSASIDVNPVSGPQCFALGQDDRSRPRTFRWLAQDVREDMQQALKACLPAMVKVKLLTGDVPEVTLDISEDTPMLVIKARLEELTGVPIQHQKVMLAGIGQLVMADKRTNIGFSHCGSTNSLYFGLLEVPPAASK